MKYYYNNVELKPVFDDGCYYIKVGQHAFASCQIEDLWKIVVSSYPVHNNDKLAEDHRKSLSDKVKQLLYNRNNPPKLETAVVFPTPTLSINDVQEIIQRNTVVSSSLSELSIPEPTAEELIDVLQNADILDDKQNALRLLWLMKDPVAVETVSKITAKPLSQTARNIVEALNKYDFSFVTRVEISELGCSILQQARLLEEISERIKICSIYVTR